MVSRDMPEKMKKAPDFELSDVNGKVIRLSNYFGNQNVVLVFLRGFM
jgi:peroxiredoxin